MTEFDLEMHRYRLQLESDTLDRACAVVEEEEYAHYVTQPIPQTGPSQDDSDSE